MDALDMLSSLAQPIANVPTAEPVQTLESEIVDGLSQSIDNIFAAVVVGGIDRQNIDLARTKAEVFKQAYAKFKNLYTQNIFKNEYAFLYSVLTSLKVSVFTWEQLDVIVDNSADDILSSDKIDLSNFDNFNGVSSTNDEKLQAFKFLLQQKFNDLSNKVVTLEEFESSCKIYNANYKEQSMLELVNDLAIVMSTGLSKRVGTGRTRIWKGQEDAQEYYRRKMALINSIDDVEGHIKTTRIDEKWLRNELEDKPSDDKQILIDTGITEIDSVHGGLHRGNVFEVMGPPKGGKTTFVTHLVSRCLRAGLNVAIWPLEGTQDEWTSALLANLLRVEHNRKNINRKKILEGLLDSDVDKQLLASAKTELALDKNRGRLSYIEGICYVEDMIDTLTDHYNNENAFDVIVMDSPLLVLSRTGKPKVDRIGEAYTTLKNFVNNKLSRKVLALVTAQLKQTAVDELRQNPKMELTETVGGESAETIRTPDYVICMTSTKEERRNGLAKIHDVAVRHTEQFKSFYARADYGAAHFYSDPGLNKI